MLVLASGSPQRRAILATLGVAFEVAAADVAEAERGEPLAVAVGNARLKAAAVAVSRPAGTHVLGADTVVVDAADGPARAVGKPADADGAAAMLRRWSGAEHRVASAVAVLVADGAGGAEELLGDVDTTLVRFRPFGEDEVRWYVGTGEWRGRAGGYAIQERGSLLVDGIDGDWWTVVGLPVALLARRLPSILR